MGRHHSLIEQIQATFNVLGQAVPAGGNVEQGGFGALAFRVLRPLQRGYRVLAIMAHPLMRRQRPQGQFGVSADHRYAPQKTTRQLSTTPREASRSRFTRGEAVFSVNCLSAAASVPQTGY